jgi:hypothetical protein
VDALIAESLACEKALQSASDYGVSWIQLELDSSVLKKVLQSNSMNFSTGGMLIKDTRDLLVQHFVCSDVSLVPRSCNSIAHKLARMGMSLDPGESHVWKPSPRVCKNFNVSRLCQAYEFNNKAKGPMISIKKEKKSRLVLRLDGH